MNIALVMPTIHIPKVLATYRELGPDVQLIVVGDFKTPPETENYCKELGALYLGVKEQKALGYACSDIIGWNCIMRRNVGILKALELGAEIVVNVDDDNMPMSQHYFEEVKDRLGEEGAEFVYEGNGWFNLGDFANESFYYRGFPYSLRGKPSCEKGWKQQLVRPGILNGLISGDPDINATERLESNPSVKLYSFFGDLFIDPKSTWSPINSQNTAYVRELAPLSFVIPGIGRYDDIWASYIAQRVMMQSDYHVMFGAPAVKQERNQHNVFKDLRDELYGMEKTEAFCECLKGIPLEGDSVLDNLQRVTDELRKSEFKQLTPFLSAWLEDCGKVM